MKQQWTEYTWGRVGDQARRLAAALQGIGPRGSAIGILSANCAHWFMADLAIMMSGHVTVPYFTITGAAPTPLPLHAWYESIGLPLNEVYGQSELLPISCNMPWDRKPGTIGKGLPGVEIKIADTGEILISGSACMKGYYRDPEKTAETLIDGWIHTGDRGELDADGFLKLTGRVKEIFKTAKAEPIVWD